MQQDNRIVIESTPRGRLLPSLRDRHEGVILRDRMKVRGGNYRTFLVGRLLHDGRWTLLKQSGRRGAEVGKQRSLILTEANVRKRFLLQGNK